MAKDWLNINDNYIVKSETYFNDSFSLDFTSVAELANYLINPDILPSLIQSPQDFLNSLMLFPFDTALYAQTPKSLMIGSFVADKVKATRISQALAFFSMGEYYVARKFNNFADYNGYTKIQVWLPYLGFVDVNTNDVMGKYMQFLLSVDYRTGQAVYYIAVSDSHIELENPPFAGNFYNECRILSTHSFQLGYNIPLGATNAAEIYRNIIMGAVKGVAVATGAYVAGVAGAGITTTTTHTTTTTNAIRSRTDRRTEQRLRPDISSRRTDTESNSRTDSSSFLKGRAITECFENSAQTLSMLALGAKTDTVNNPSLVARGSEQVKVVIYRPIFKPINYDYDHLFGRPLGEVRELQSVRGYTEVTEVHVEGEEFNTATETELAMLQDTLLNGIIL